MVFHVCLHKYFLNISVFWPDAYWQKNQFLSPEKPVSVGALRIILARFVSDSCKTLEEEGWDHLRSLMTFIKSTNSGNGFSWRRSTSPQHRPTSHRGGGLLTLVKDGIVYQRIAEVYQPPMEKQSIQLQLCCRRWATIHNLYAVLAPTEPGNLFLAGGGLKAHSTLWGVHQPARPTRRTGRRLASLPECQHPQQRHNSMRKSGHRRPQHTRHYSCQQRMVNPDRVNGRRKFRIRPSLHHDQHQVRSTGGLSVSTQRPLEHKERWLEFILCCRRRSNRAILDSPFVTRR